MIYYQVGGRVLSGWGGISVWAINRGWRCRVKINRAWGGVYILCPWDQSSSISLHLKNMSQP